MNEEQKNTEKISIEDFKKVEVRIGEVKNAEIVPDADKLLRLEVDFGADESGVVEIRQIVSGIREFFSPEQIIGKKFPFVTNLMPRTIKGFESNGMIMAAKDIENNFSLLNVDEKIKNGTKIS